MEPKYPDIDVQLTGQDGNAYNLMGIVTKQMKRNDVPKEDIDEFLKQATSDDYDHLLITCMKWVNVS